MIPPPSTPRRRVGTQETLFPPLAASFQRQGLSFFYLAPFFSLFGWSFSFYSVAGSPWNYTPTRQSRTPDVRSRDPGSEIVLAASFFFKTFGPLSVHQVGLPGPCCRGETGSFIVDVRYWRFYGFFLRVVVWRPLFARGSAVQVQE